MSYIKVIKPGFYTTIQDRGRYGLQKWGVPVAGAMDEYNLRLANILVGNEQNEGCLEITLLGPTLIFEMEGLIALTGADLGAQLNGREFPMYESVKVKNGDLLEFAGLKSGCRAYLAVSGGFDVPVIMGSKSTYVRGKFGGFQGRPLQEGDEISVAISKQPMQKFLGRKVPIEYRSQFSNQIDLRVVMGPQEESFTQEGIRTFLNSTYQVTHEADRMGYRLDGPKIEHKKGPDIISDGIAFGSVQVPGHGLPIVMMADRQTTGGYTKIATVITPDLNKLAQAKPGDKVRFQPVSLEKAHRLYREYEEKINKLKEYLEKEEKSEEKQQILTSGRKLLIKIDGKEYMVEIEESRL